MSQHSFPQHSSLQTPIIILPSLMGPGAAKFLDSLNEYNPPPLNPGGSLSQIVNIPADIFPHLWSNPNLPKLIDETLINFNEDQTRAFYILQIVILAYSRTGHSFQDSIRAVRRSGILRELVRPADSFTVQQIYAIRMIFTAAVVSGMAVDHIASIYDHGRDLGIVYPIFKFNDWADDPEKDCTCN
ncbi:hypothetical protein VNI00_016736 [Paramarasmius palmivorus]|uniref:Uncharacterized protein n=1 Tax=Paramarasmius palmivorus TaxID=297713 RepID=A0AAW0BD27_9AGAR